jgi:hypothetical protein
LTALVLGDDAALEELTDVVACGYPFGSALTFGTKDYPTLTLTVIHAHERGTPADRDSIRWELPTDLPVEDVSSAIEKLDWYTLRWKVETYHKVLKSGCRAEHARLRTAERLGAVVD